MSSSSDESEESESSPASTTRQDRSSVKKRKRDNTDEPDSQKHDQSSPTPSPSNASAKDDAGEGNAAGAATVAAAPPKKRKYTRRAPRPAPAAKLEIEANDNPTSPFIVQTTSFYLPLAPIAQGSPLEGMCAEHLSPLLLSYVQSFKGVVLSYSNPHFSSSAAGPTSDSSVQGQGPALAKSIAEYAAAHTWISADFTLLKPSRYVWIEGYVTVQSHTHLGLVCWNLFNASIERKRIPEGWTWVSASSSNAAFSRSSKFDKRKKKGNADVDADTHADENADTDADVDADTDADTDADAETQRARSTNNNDDDDEAHVVDGYWRDADGKKVDGMLKFRVRDLETTPSFGKENGFVSIEGSLLDDEAEIKMDRREAIIAGKAKAAAQRAAAAAKKTEANGGGGGDDSQSQSQEAH